jgi:hypothetical protein
LKEARDSTVLAEKRITFQKQGRGQQCKILIREPRRGTHRIRGGDN